MNSLSQKFKLEDFLYQKKIHLVGNARPDDSGEDCESLLVRMNAGVGDCSILWQSADLSPGFVDQERPSLRWLIVNISGAHYLEWIEWASWQHIEVYEFDSLTYKGAHPRGPLYDWSSCLGKRLETSPLSGIFALEFFSSFPVAELFLSGFNFFWRNGSVPAFMYSHRLKPQGEYMAEKLATDARIKAHWKISKLLRTGVWNEPRFAMQPEEKTYSKAEV